MFDVGFAEILVLAVTGLLVIGPEKLLGTIRTLFQWLGYIKRSFNDIKADLEDVVGADEIRTQLRQDSIMADFKKDKQELEILDKSVRQANIDLLDSFTMSEEKSSLRTTHKNT